MLIDLFDQTLDGKIKCYHGAKSLGRAFKAVKEGAIVSQARQDTNDAEILEAYELLLRRMGKDAIITAAGKKLIDLFHKYIGEVDQKIPDYHKGENVSEIFKDHCVWVAKTIWHPLARSSGKVLFELEIPEGCYVKEGNNCAIPGGIPISYAKKLYVQERYLDMECDIPLGDVYELLREHTK